MSQHETNKMVRVLNGTKLKYTIRVHAKDGNITEWQSDERPKITWQEADRSLWVCGGAYGDGPIMRFPEDGIMLCEENPKE